MKEVACVLDEWGIHPVWAGLEVSLTAVQRQCEDILPGVGTLTPSRQQGCFPAAAPALDASCLTPMSQWSVNLRHRVCSIVLASVGHVLANTASKVLME